MELNQKYFFDKKKYISEEMKHFSVLISTKYFRWIRTTLTGKKILDKLDGEKTIKEIIREISDEYFIPEKIVNEDVTVFCEKAYQNGIIFKSKNEVDEPKFSNNIKNLFIDITNYCNKRCLYCNKNICKTKSESQFVQLSVIEKYFIELFPGGKCSDTIVFITGGEPMFHGDLVEIIEFIRTYNAKIFLWTNGSLFNNAIAKKFKKNDVAIFLSIDSSKIKVNDKLRGKGSYSKIIRAAQICRNTNLVFYFALTISKLNTDYFDDIIGLIKKEGAQGFFINQSIPFNEDGGKVNNIINIGNNETFKEKMPKLDITIRVTKKIRNKRIDMNKRIFLLHEEHLCNNNMYSIEKKINCGAGINTLSIDVFSNVYPCKALHRKEFCLGNLSDYNKKRMHFDIPDFLKNFDFCTNCYAEIFCLGGCKNRIKTFSNKDSKIMEYCMHTRRQMKMQLWTTHIE